MRPTATGLPDIGITPVSWDFEAEQERLMRLAIGNELYDWLEKEDARTYFSRISERHERDTD